MCRQQKFFRCAHCGNLIGMVENHGVPMMCCGQPMQELVPNTVEAAVEKHLPVATVEGNTIKVAIGSVAHPMEEAHHISFIYLQTQNGGQRKCLTVGSPAEASFALVDDKPIAVFAYCNLHGLWRLDL